MKRLFLFFIFFLVSFGQMPKVRINPETAAKHKENISFKKSEIQTASAKELHPRMDIRDYKISVVNLSKINPENDEESLIKAQKTLLKKQTPVSIEEETYKTEAVSPVILTDFSANTYDGCYPPDNALAYSPASGYLVSATNCTINYYDRYGQVAYSKSLKGFFNNQYTAFLYDPVLHYDPQINRFIMVMLHGFTPSVSKVLLCVSQSSNPLDGWWTYELPGDPEGIGIWFDYPKLAVSDKEIFITGNQYDANDSYYQSIIYQITKTPLTSGQSISYIYWTDNSGRGTILPLSAGGSSNYGPGLFLITLNSATDKIYLYDITDYIGNNPSFNAYSVNSSYNITIGGNALQQGTSVKLDVGNTRPLSGFYQNGVVHFVHNNDAGNNYNGLMYHRITISTNGLSEWSKIFNASGYDYVYPSVAWIGSSSSDKSVVINFVRSSSSSYPEHRVVIFDNAGNASASVEVQAGNTYVDHNGNATQTARWGDYTGITRDHATNTVWVAGHYGTNTTYYYNVFGSRIARIGRSDQAANIEDIKNVKEVKVFPNPAPEYFYLTFSLTRPELISVDLYSVNGQKIQTLLRDKVKQGKNKLSFDTKTLAPGEYILQIKTADKIIKNEKIIIY